MTLAVLTTITLICTSQPDPTHCRNIMVGCYKRRREWESARHKREDEEFWVKMRSLGIHSVNPVQIPYSVDRDDGDAVAMCAP